MPKNSGSNILRSVSAFGIIAFFLLYIYASRLYPGGTTWNSESVGFSWLYNYWCHLLSPKALNGEINPAMKPAIFAMFLLCVSISLFFWQFPTYIKTTNTWKWGIRIGGLVSMALAAGLFTEHHDLLSILSSIFALVALIGILLSLYKNQMFKQLTMAFICIASLLITNVIYYSEIFIKALPVFQKASMLLTLLWLLYIIVFHFRKKQVLNARN